MANTTKAKVVGINGNMVTIEFDGAVSMNEVGYVNVDGKKLRGEVIRIRGNKAQMQIFEMTQGIKENENFNWESQVYLGIVSHPMFN